MDKDNLKNDIHNGVKKMKRDVIIADVVVMLLGIVMIVYPGASGMFICRLVGAALCLLGAVRIAVYFIGNSENFIGSFALVQGIVLAGFGIFFLVRPQILASFLTVIMGIILVISGVIKIQYGTDLARLHIKFWWIELIGAVLMVILGVITFFNPFSAAKTLMVFVGICFLFNGVWDLVSIIWLSLSVKKVKKNMDQNGIESMVDKVVYPQADENGIIDENSLPDEDNH